MLAQYTTYFYVNLCLLLFLLNEKLYVFLGKKYKIIIKMLVSFFFCVCVKEKYYTWQSELYWLRLGEHTSSSSSAT